MPHIIVKLYPGRSEEQKHELTRTIVKNVVDIATCKETSVSVAFEEIPPEDWTEKVYLPDIMDGPGILYKKPGYDPFSSTPDEKPETAGLMEYVREQARIAHKEETTGNFDAMSWLDLELEDHPDVFDRFFEKPWHDLSGPEQGERAIAIRRVL